MSSGLTDQEILELKNLLGGGHVNVLPIAPIGGRNPKYEIERTVIAPYQIIIHERYNYNNPSRENVHLITTLDLDGLDGNVTHIEEQVRSDDP